MESFGAVLFSGDSQSSVLRIMFEEFGIAAPIYGRCELAFSVFVWIVFVEIVELPRMLARANSRPARSA
jgi:hypothetical protein